MDNVRLNISCIGEAEWKEHHMPTLPDLHENYQQAVNHAYNKDGRFYGPSVFLLTTNRHDEILSKHMDLKYSYNPRLEHVEVSAKKK